MNKGQEMFFDYILERTNTESRDQATILLLESFKKQEQGVFETDDLNQFHNKIINYLKPEHIDEVIQVMLQYGPQEINK